MSTDQTVFFTRGYVTGSSTAVAEFVDEITNSASWRGVRPTLVDIRDGAAEFTLKSTRHPLAGLKDSTQRYPVTIRYVACDETGAEGWEGVYANGDGNAARCPAGDSLCDMVFGENPWPGDLIINIPDDGSRRSAWLVNISNGARRQAELIRNLRHHLERKHATWDDDPVLRLLSSLDLHIIQSALEITVNQIQTEGN